MRGGGKHKQVTTDENGRFEAEVDANKTCDTGFYKYKTGPQNQEPNGVPHVHVIGEYETGTGETDFGTLTVSEGHLVQVQALDSEGNPVRDARGSLTVKGSTGHYLRMTGDLNTNFNGYFVVDNTSYSGIELAGTVELSVSIPNGNGGAMQYTEEFFVEEPLNITAQIGEGMTFTPAREEQATETPKPTTTTTENPGTKVTTTTENPDKTTTAPEGTESQGESEAGTTTTADQNTTEDNAVSRGFFSNGETSEDLAFLTNPFFLTIGGFVLSVAGIAQSLIRGN